MQTPNDDAISVADAAPLIGRSPRGMYRAIAAGHVPVGCYFRIGRDIYVSRSRLIAWRDAGGTAANDARSAALASA